MLRAALRPLGRAPAAPLLRPAPAAWRAAAPTVTRSFAAAVGKKPKLEDGTLEGRYATALFMASSDKLDKVQKDLTAIRDMMNDSKDFKLMVETPGIDPESKVAALEAVCQKAGTEPTVVSFLKVLVENKRMHLLGRMIDLFEAFYRAEKGMMLCKVTSAAPLTSDQQQKVKQAMEARAGKGAQLIMEYNTNASLLGGLVVKMDEAVFDFSVSTRIERLQAQLLQPMT